MCFPSVSRAQLWPLVITPYVSTTIGTAQIAATLALMQKGVDIHGNLPDWYASGCYVGGIGMILIGIIASIPRQTH